MSSDSSVQPNPKEFDSYSHYYDLIYKDKNYAEEVAYINTLLHRLGLQTGEILELGSGTGKHGCLLGEKGYRVTGLERSASMAARANKTANFECIVGDACDSKLNRKFDAVLALFHVVSYQTSNESLIKLFRNAHDHLALDGFFVFDVWYSSAVGRSPPEVRIKRVSNARINVTRLAEPVIRSEKNQVDVNYTIIVEDKMGKDWHSFKELHAMRHFSTPEILLLCEMVGFELLSAEEFLTGKTPSQDTWGVCYVLRKTR
jgi:SAM-dependent methyltransferase